MINEFLDSVVKSAELALKAAGESSQTGEEDQDATGTQRKTSTSAGGGEVGGSGKMFKTTGKTIKTAAAKAKDVAATGTGALAIAKTPEALKMLQQTSKDFKVVVNTSKAITTDIQRLMTKMPTDKVSDIKQAGVKNVTKLQQNVDRYFQDMNDQFEDEPTARVATVGMLAQLIVNMDKAAK
jgi:hypothetical protein